MMRKIGITLKTVGIGITTRSVLMTLRLYQLTLSYWLGRHCRFTPSCSHYMVDAIKIHGLATGGRLGIRRICRCGPPWITGSPGGHDPVPERLPKRLPDRVA